MANCDLRNCCCVAFKDDWKRAFAEWHEQYSEAINAISKNCAPILDTETGGTSGAGIEIINITVCAPLDPQIARAFCRCCTTQSPGELLARRIGGSSGGACSALDAQRGIYYDSCSGLRVAISHDMRKVTVPGGKTFQNVLRALSSFCSCLLRAAGQRIPIKEQHAQLGPVSLVCVSANVYMYAGIWPEDGYQFLHREARAIRNSIITAAAAAAAAKSNEQQQLDADAVTRIMKRVPGANEADVWQFVDAEVSLTESSRMIFSMLHTAPKAYIEGNADIHGNPTATAGAKRDGAAPPPKSVPWRTTRAYVTRKGTIQCLGFRCHHHLASTIYAILLSRARHLDHVIQEEEETATTHEWTRMIQFLKAQVGHILPENIAAKSLNSPISN